MATTPAQQAHYRKNRERYIEQSRQQRLWFKRFVDWLKSIPCADCGVQYPPYVMHFDHVRGRKVGDISRLVIHKNLPALVAEIRKCDVVCANCHAERTHCRAGVA